MKPVKLTNATRTLGAPGNWSEADGECESLDIFDYQSENGNVMASAWMLEDEDIEQLKSGSMIWLHIYGQQHPVVALAIK